MTTTIKIARNVDVFYLFQVTYGTTIFVGIVVAKEIAIQIDVQSIDRLAQQKPLES